MPGRQTEDLRDQSSGNRRWEGGWTGQRPGRQVQTRAASWAGTTLIPGVYFSVGLPPGLVGPWRAGTCLGFMPAPDHGVQTRSLHQKVETEKLGSVGGDGCGWVPAGAAPLRDPGKARLSNKSRVCLATAPGYRTLLVKTVGFLKTLSSSDSAPKPPSSSSLPEVFPDPPSSGRQWVWGWRVGEGGGKGTDKGEGRGRRGRS